LRLPLEASYILLYWVARGTPLTAGWCPTGRLPPVLALTVLTLLLAASLAGSAGASEWLGVLVAPEAEGGDSFLVDADLGGGGWALLVEACGAYWIIQGDWAGGPLGEPVAAAPGDAGLLAVARAPWGVAAAGSTPEGQPLIIVYGVDGSTAYTVKGSGDYTVRGEILDLAVAGDGSLWAVLYARLGFTFFGEFQAVEKGLMLVRLGGDGSVEAFYSPGWPPEGSVTAAALLPGPEAPLLAVEAGIAEKTVYIVDVAGGRAVRVSYEPGEYPLLLLGGAAYSGGLLAAALTAESLSGYSSHGLLIVLNEDLEPVYTAALTGPPIVEAQAAAFTGDGSPVFAVQTLWPERGALANYILDASTSSLVYLGRAFTKAEAVHPVNGYAAVAATYEVRIPYKDDPTINLLYDYAGIALAPLNPQGEEAIAVDSSTVLTARKADTANLNIEANPQTLTIAPADPPQPNPAQVEVEEAQPEQPQPQCSLTLKPLQRIAEEAGEAEDETTTTTTTTTSQPGETPTPETPQIETQTQQQQEEQEDTEATLNTATLALAGLALAGLAALTLLLRKR